MHPYMGGGLGFFFGFLFMLGWITAVVLVVVALWRIMTALEAINASLRQIAVGGTTPPPAAGERPGGE